MTILAFTIFYFHLQCWTSSLCYIFTNKLEQESGSLPYTSNGLINIFFICRMAMTMLTIYLHYEDVKQDVKILQRSMMRRYVSYYDLISMIEEVGFKAIDYLYYERKDPHDLYLVHIDGDSDVIKMLSDLENEKIVHMHVSKEKASDMYVFKEKASDDIAPPNSRNDISPSNHPNESVLLQDDGGSAVVEEQLIVKRPQSIVLKCLLHICIRLLLLLE